MDLTTQELDIIARKGREFDLQDRISDEDFQNVEDTYQKNLKSFAPAIESTFKGVNITLDEVIRTDLKDIDFHKTSEILVYDLLNEKDIVEHYLMIHASSCAEFLKEFETDQSIFELTLKDMFERYYSDLAKVFSKDVNIKSLRASKISPDEVSRLFNGYKELKKYRLFSNNVEVSIYQVSTLEHMETLYLGEEEKKMSEGKIYSGDTKITGKSIEYPQLSNFNNIQTSPSGRDLGVVSDVPLQLTAVLGSAKCSVKEVLDLNVGKIIELDRLEDDPILIYANGKLVAEGEVVVVGDYFGTKITKVYDKETLKNIK